MEEFTEIVEYIHELSVMKRRGVSGFDQFIKQNHCNLASHAYRSSIIGMIIAEKEGANIAKVGIMLVIHENAETRTGDPDFLAKRYGMKENDSERRAYKAQTKKLQKKLGVFFYNLFKEKEECETLEAKCACDADILDHIFSAKEFFDEGVQGAKTWLDYKYKFNTKTGESIFNAMLKSNSNDWLEEFS